MPSMRRAFIGLRSQPSTTTCRATRSSLASSRRQSNSGRTSTGLAICTKQCAQEHDAGSDANWWREWLAASRAHCGRRRYPSFNTFISRGGGAFDAHYRNGPLVGVAGLGLSHLAETLRRQRQLPRDSRFAWHRYRMGRRYGDALSLLSLAKQVLTFGTPQLAKGPYTSLRPKSGQTWRRLAKFALCQSATYAPQQTAL